MIMAKKQTNEVDERVRNGGRSGIICVGLKG